MIKEAKNREKSNFGERNKTNRGEKHWLNQLRTSRKKNGPKVPHKGKRQLLDEMGGKRKQKGVNEHNSYLMKKKGDLHLRGSLT